MRIAADKIHNGKKFLPPHSVIRVNETGCIEAVELMLKQRKLMYTMRVSFVPDLSMHIVI
jgi:hypothetical protein